MEDAINKNGMSFDELVLNRQLDTMTDIFNMILDSPDPDFIPTEIEDNSGQTLSTPMIYDINKKTMSIRIIPVNNDVLIAYQNLVSVLNKNVRYDNLNAEDTISKIVK